MKAVKLLLILVLCSALAENLWAQVTLMPLGDSITEGVGDPGENGYRRRLWESLSADGYDFNFVGSLAHGIFSENQHEGHGGWTDFNRSFRDKLQ